MSLQDFAVILNNTVYLALGILAFINYVRNPDHTRLSVALLFGSTTLIVLLSLINRSLDARIVSLIGVLLLTTHPYLLLRLVKLFRQVPAWLEQSALFALFICWGLEILIPVPYPPLISVLIAAYIVFFEVYGAYAFFNGALTTRGVTRWRMTLAAVGSASIGAVIFIAGLVAIFPDIIEVVRTVNFTLAITSGIAYYLAFATPRWLRQALQNTELYYFLRENASYPVDQRANETLTILRRAALRAIGGRATLIVEDETKSTQIFLRATGEFKSFSLTDTQTQERTAIDRVWEHRRPVILHNLAPDEARLAKEFGADTIFIVPIMASEKLWGLLLVFAYGKPIFAEDDLNLLMLFAEQSAMTLDYAAATDELKRTYQADLSRFFRLSNSLILITGFDKTVKMVSPAWERTLGYTPEEIARMGTDKLVHPDDLEATQKILLQLTQGIEVGSFENRYIGKDGSVHWLSWNSLPLVDTKTIYAVAHNITDIKQNQEALRQNEEQLRHIADNVPALIARLDSNQHYLFVNRAYENWFGKSPEAIRGKHLREVLGETIYNEILPHIQEVLQGNNVSYEISSVLKDGKLHYALESYVPDVDVDGKVKGYYAMTTDITERKEAENVLFIGSQRLRFLNDVSRIMTEAVTDYERMLDMIVRQTAEQMQEACLIRLLSKDGKWLEPVAYHNSNPEHYELVSQAIAQNPLPVDGPYTGESFKAGKAIILARKDVEAFRQNIPPAMREIAEKVDMKTMISVPLRVEGRSIGQLYLSRQRNDLPDYTHEDLLLIVNLADRVAMAVRNAQLLREKEEAFALLDALYSSAPVGLAYLDRNLNYQRINKALAHMNDYPPEGHLGHSMKELLSVAPLVEREVADEIQYVFQQVLEEGQIQKLETTKVTHGEQFHYHIIYYPVSVRNEILGIGKIVLDVTEWRQVEEDLRNTAHKLQLSNIELQNFAYIASHDLQEPLRKVQAFGDRLKAKYAANLDEQGQDFLERMQNAAKRMQTLIQDLLIYSRLSSQAKPFENVNLNEVLSDVVNDLEIRVRETHAQIDCGELAVIEGDPTQLQQLFQNLLSNALKYHREGVAPQIKISGHTLVDNKYEIRVSDNGIGFDEKYLDRIFGFFQRLHGKTSYEGTGMGLAICKRIVDRHNGTITAISQVGQGATFIVTLPLKQRKEARFGKHQYEQISHTHGR